MITFILEIILEILSILGETLITSLGSLLKLLEHIKTFPQPVFKAANAQG